MCWGRTVVGMLYDTWSARSTRFCSTISLIQKCLTRVTSLRPVKTMAGVQPYLTLYTGAKMPLMGFGTLMENLEPDHQRVVDIVETAIDVGYRHLDTAQIYNTEAMVGEAIRNKIKSGVVSRDEIFLVTKLWRTAYSREDVVPSLKKSLEKLGFTYVDLFLVHWPTAFKSGEDMFPTDEFGKLIYADTDYLDTWKGMEECVDLGLTKAIGLSNFNSKQITRLLDNCRIKPANHQVESHPFLTNSNIVQFCQTRGITMTAYTPLGGFNPDYRQEQGWPTIFQDATIAAIAQKHKKTSAQVALRYQMQRGVAVTPKSAQRTRIEENFGALSFELTTEDMRDIENCNRGLRLNAEFPDHPYYPFHEDF